MYNFIKPHYDDDDIWQRKKEYYSQVVNSNGKRMSPHKVIKLQQVPKPGTINHVLQGSKLSEPHSLNYQQYPKPSLPLNLSQIKPNQFNQKQSLVNLSLQQTDPQRFKVLQQRAQLYNKLQSVTLGLPLTQNTPETQLLSPNFIMPHYKSQKITQLKTQEKHIKKLTAQMLENQKVIANISRTKNILVDRIGRIRQIDQEIYEKLDEDRSQQVENYLRMAKNLLAQGESEDKIAAVLKKILY